MTKAKQGGADYAELQEELDTILAELQRTDIDVDEALKKYQRGQELIGQLEAYLKTAENTVKRLESKPGKTDPV